MERNLFLWILAGLVIGAAAKLLLPGREPGGFVLALLLGIAGALAGGFLLLALGGPGQPLVQSLAASAAGAVLALLLYRIVIHARSR